MLEELQLGSRTLLRVQHTNHGGTENVDVRKWYTDASEQLMPTRKGVQLHLDEVSVAAELLRLGTGVGGRVSVEPYEAHGRKGLSLKVTAANGHWSALWVDTDTALKLVPLLVKFAPKVEVA